jgi:hypothetical protein
LFRISLLSSISIILGLASSFIAYEAFFIKLLGNFLPLHNKPFLLIFIIGLHHLLNNVCFGGYIEWVGSSFRQFISLFFSQPQNKVLNSLSFSFFMFILYIVFEVFLKWWKFFNNCNHLKGFTKNNSFSMDIMQG